MCFHHVTPEKHIGAFFLLFLFFNDLDRFNSSFYECKVGDKGIGSGVDIVTNGCWKRGMKIGYKYK